MIGINPLNCFADIFVVLEFILFWIKKLMFY